MNGFRRNAEYTDEHIGFEKRITQGAEKDAKIYQTIEKLRAQAENGNIFSKNLAKFRLKGVEKKLELYQSYGKDFTNSE